MNINTTQLLNRLSQSKDIGVFLDENEAEFLDLSCLDLLTDMAELKKLSVAGIARRSGQGDYVYKVFRGERRPSRDVLLCIAVGMSLSIHEAQLLLRVSKQAALDPRDRRDSVVLYALKESLGIERLNDLLYELLGSTL